MKASSRMPRLALVTFVTTVFSAVPAAVVAVETFTVQVLAQATIQARACAFCVYNTVITL